MFKQALQICKKDFLSELRTRYAVNALLMFVIVVISVIKFSIGDEKLTNEINAGMLWIIIFFATSSGLSRVFVAEEERGTSLLLKLVSSSSSVFLGKLLFNISLTFILNLFIIFLYIVITNLTINSFGLFVLCISLGNFGLSGVLTIIAALISRASSKGTLYPVLSFPLLLPLLLSSISSTFMCIEGTSIEGIAGELQIIVSYSIVLITASFLLFDLIWKD
jgi:heme exporter protein B